MNPLREYGEEIALTVFVFSLLTWVYVVCFQILYPAQVTGGATFSHIGFPPFNWRVDDVGMLSFAISAIGFLTWRVQLKKSSERESRRKH